MRLGHTHCYAADCPYRSGRIQWSGVAARPDAIDTERGVSYWGTGNLSPVPGLKGYPNGSSRPGPNLYTNSLVALDHRLGKFLWYNQVKPHDLFNMVLIRRRDNHFGRHRSACIRTMS
jgi:glucose dehydrogenase